MKIVGLVPARGGSKGVPRKNMLTLQGKSLVHRACEIGLQTCDEVWVSSEDPEILAEAVAVGARFLKREEGLAQDDTPMLNVVQDALAQLPGTDILVLLQPTQPFRTVAHIRAGIELFREKNADSVVSVVLGESPDWALVVQHDGTLARWVENEPWYLAPKTRRQDCRPAYYRDGTVYVLKPSLVMDTDSLYGDKNYALVIPRSQSCNIDTDDDWNRAQMMARERDGRQYSRS